MAYAPLKDYRAKDQLPSGDPNKIIRGSDISDELEAISNAIATNSGLASVKFNGEQIKYGYNVSSVQSLGSGTWRVNFETPINNDGTITLPNGQVVNPGDFAGVVTPYTTNGRMVIASITDQQEAYVDIVFRELNGTNWEPPAKQGFAFLLVDQVPENN